MSFLTSTLTLPLNTCHIILTMSTSIFSITLRLLLFWLTLTRDFVWLTLFVFSPRRLILFVFFYFYPVTNTIITHVIRGNIPILSPSTKISTGSISLIALKFLSCTITSLRFFKTVLHSYNIRYYIDMIFRFPLRRSYLFHGAIDDYTAEDIFMRHVIHKGMNIDYVAYKCKI